MRSEGLARLRRGLERGRDRIEIAAGLDVPATTALVHQMNTRFTSAVKRATHTTTSSKPTSAGVANLPAAVGARSAAGSKHLRRRCVTA